MLLGTGRKLRVDCSVVVPVEGALRETPATGPVFAYHEPEVEAQDPPYC